MYYHDHADVLALARTYLPDCDYCGNAGSVEECANCSTVAAAYPREQRLQLIAYLRALNAYRTRIAATLLREQYPNSVTIHAAYIRALNDYTRSLRRLPSWCAPPSYVAEGM